MNILTFIPIILLAIVDMIETSHQSEEGRESWLTAISRLTSVAYCEISIGLPSDIILF